MRSRQVLHALLAAVGIGGAAAMGVACGAPAPQQDYVVRVNDKLFTATDVAAVQETRRRVATVVAQVAIIDPDPDATPVDRSAITAANLDQTVIAEQLIQDELFAEEAQRRQLVCSDAEVSSNVFDRLIGGDLALIVALATYAPKGYLQTPAGERTAFGESLIATYVADPRAVSEEKHQCEISKLYSVLAARDANGRVNNDVRNKAIADLKAELIASASIDRKPGY